MDNIPGDTRRGAAQGDRRVSQEELQAFVENLFGASGLDPEQAKPCAETFVLQEMRGVHHHGLGRLVSTLDGLRDGSLNPRPRIRVVGGSGATVLLDADRAPGMLACHEAMSHAMTGAGSAGIGMAVVRNSSHFLAAAPYCIRAAEAGYVGIAFSNSPASMAYPGARGAVLGNGPFGYAVPTGADFPIVFDAAMTVSGGRLIEMAQSGEMLPPALAGLDARGEVTTDPAAILDGGATLPIGLHKGAGLVLLFEILTGVLGGGAFLYAGGRDLVSETQCCIAIRTDFFTPADRFRDRISRYVRGVVAEARSSGGDVLLPGERAHRSLQRCMRDGVVLDSETAEALRDQARRLNLIAPF